MKFSGGLIAVIFLLAFLVVGAFVGIGSYITYKNLAVQSEASIEATYKNNQSILSNYTTKVQEAAQVTDMARDDLSKVMKDALTARYGSDGSKAVFNWIQENYPGQVNGKLYEKIQQIVESGRNDFQAAQTKLLDQLRLYEVQRNEVWSGFWIGVAGYPKKDLSQFKIITTDDVQEKFESGKDSTITIRKPDAAKT